MVVFYVCVCAEVSLYIDSYKDVDIYDGNEAVFCIVFPGMFVRDQRKAWFLCIH